MEMITHVLGYQMKHILSIKNHYSNINILLKFKNSQMISFNGILGEMLVLNLVNTLYIFI